MIRSIALCVALLCAGPVAAQTTGFGGLARLDPDASAVSGTRNGVTIDLALSQGVPYRVFTLDAPPRLVVDFREVDWAGTLAPSC